MPEGSSGLGSPALERVGRGASGAWRDRAALAGVVVFHLALALLVFDPTPNTGGDNAHYITLARALLEGRGYVDLHDPATPPHTLYPPVFPALLAAAMLLGAKPWIGLKLVIVAFSALAVGGTFLWLRRRGGTAFALGVSAIVAASPGVLDQSHWILSDPPFWAFAMLALWSLERSAGGSRGHDGRRLAVLVLAVGLAWFTRSAGLPLVGAAAVCLALEKRWRDLIVLAIVLGPLGAAWWLRSVSAPGGYVDQFWMVNPYAPELGRAGIGDLVVRVGENAQSYAEAHLPWMLVGAEGALPVALALVVIAAAAIGWVRALVVRGPGIAELFAPLYLAMILLWPAAWAGERFVLPILPVVLAFAAEAAGAGIARIRPGAVRWAGVLAAAGIVAFAAPAVHAAAKFAASCRAAVRGGDRYACLSPRWADFFGLAEWAGAGLPEDAVVFSRKPRIFHFLSGRKGRIFPMTRDPAEFFVRAEEIGARYVVVDQVDALSATYVAEVVARRPTAFCFLRAQGTGSAILFGILPGAAGIADVPERLDSARFERCPADYVSSSSPRE